MLKWVARNDKSLGPFGIITWQLYVEAYNCPYSVQSLCGRMRRQIVPNIDYYSRHLKSSDLISLERRFGSRLGAETRKYIRNLAVKTVKIVQVVASRPVEKNSEIEVQKVASLELQAAPTAPTTSAAQLGKTKSPGARTQRIERNDELSRDVFESSCASTIVEPEPPQEEPPQRSHNWKTEMRKIAGQAAQAINDLIRQTVENNDFNKKMFAELENQQNLDHLYGKMFDDPNKADWIMIDVKKFTENHLRMQYFRKIREELHKRFTNQHIIRAVFCFFQFFEYYVTVCVDESTDNYILLMNKVLEMSIKLLPLYIVHC